MDADVEKASHDRAENKHDCGPKVEWNDGPVMRIEDGFKHFLQDARGMKPWKRLKAVLLHGKTNLTFSPGASEKSKAAVLCRFCGLSAFGTIKQDFNHRHSFRELCALFRAGRVGPSRFRALLRPDRAASRFHYRCG